MIAGAGEREQPHVALQHHGLGRLRDAEQAEARRELALVHDPVADQDHMALHEWLQQLKDKVMSHLELLMQRGDIKGPPYVMPDNIELSFLRKFIERRLEKVPA